MSTTTLGSLRQAISRQSDLILVAAVLGILMILFTPIPSVLLDVLIITNFSFALLILLLTFYVEKPLQFSTFPSLLLIATLFRLSLNIAATRLILSDADAGKVIGAIGEHVVAGNYVIGLIVFIVLIVVQYVVVTNGAQRVAEVAARFTLDSMPGKQMSIDADMNIGLIDESEARQRRLEIEKEGNFYGAMDGASKFVKGDAIAGIIIILIDILGGLAIGVAQRGMSWADALHTFTLLTVGDGIVTQIPALIISTGTGIIVTRAASDVYLSKEVSKQITAYPKTLLVIAAGLLGLLFLPGIPVLPVLVVLSIISALAYYGWRELRKSEKDESEGGTATEGEGEDIYSMLLTDAIELRLGSELHKVLSREDSLLMDRIKAFRKQYALDMGLVIPAIKIRADKKTKSDEYRIHIHGISTASGVLKMDGLLAIDPGNTKNEVPGTETKDPTYGLPARWIATSDRAVATDAGYTIVEPANVLMTHLSETLKQHASALLTRAETQRLVDAVKESDNGLVDELVPSILSLSEIQKILQNLIDEKVSIRNMQQILEVLIDSGRETKDPFLLTEAVRGKLGAIIIQSLANGDGELSVLTLDPEVERALHKSLTENGPRQAGGLIIEPTFAERLIKRLAEQSEKMMNSNLMPVLLISPELRRHFFAFVSRIIPHLSVVSLNEIPKNAKMKSFGLVTM